jgi:hypothetical protein
VSLGQHDALAGTMKEEASDIRTSMLACDEFRQCDFNFISNRNDPDAPTALLQFTLEIGNNNGVLLTNFAPESVPEPSSLVLAGTVALVGLGVGQWRRRD